MMDGSDSDARCPMPRPFHLDLRGGLWGLIIEFKLFLFHFHGESQRWSSAKQRVVCSFASVYLYRDVLLFMQMDYIAGSFYDGFLLYAMALEETLAEGGAQNDGISITMKMQNRRIWGKKKQRRHL